MKTQKIRARDMLFSLEQEAIHLEKKLARLGRKYDRAEKNPILRARIMKSAVATQAKLDAIKGR